jgi:hypothetical protein
VFTNNTDKDKFISKLNPEIFNYNEINIYYLILSNFTNIDIVEKNNSFICIKKLYALFVLYEKYDYISCIDSEIKFIGNDDYYNTMKNIVDSKIICGGKLPDHSHYPEKKIVQDSLTLLTHPKYHESLKLISHDYKLYTWWSNLPVYDCKIAKEFLEYIDFNNTNLDRFCYNVFDDMTYNFFCILLQNYEFKLIPHCIHSLEFSHTDLVEYVDNTLCKLYWVNNFAYSQNKSYYENNGFKIVYHLDRWPHITIG